MKKICTEIPLLFSFNFQIPVLIPERNMIALRKALLMKEFSLARKFFFIGAW